MTDDERAQEWREFHEHAKRLIADEIIRNGFAGIGGALQMIYQGWATIDAKNRATKPRKR